MFNISKFMAILQEERDDDITDFESFEFQSRFITNTANVGTLNVEITVPLKQ